MSWFSEPLFHLKPHLVRIPLNGIKCNTFLRSLGVVVSTSSLKKKINTCCYLCLFFFLTMTFMSFNLVLSKFTSFISSTEISIKTVLPERFQGIEYTIDNQQGEKICPTVILLWTNFPVKLFPYMRQQSPFGYSSKTEVFLIKKQNHGCITRRYVKQNWAHHQEITFSTTKHECRKIMLSFTWNWGFNQSGGNNEYL